MSIYIWNKHSGIVKGIYIYPKNYLPPPSLHDQKILELWREEGWKHSRKCLPLQNIKKTHPVTQTFILTQNVRTLSFLHVECINGKNDKKG